MVANFFSLKKYSIKADFTENAPEKFRKVKETLLKLKFLLSKTILNSILILFKTVKTVCFVIFVDYKKCITNRQFKVVFGFICLKINY